ncbi:hypothetical protein, partial [Vibrio harveyi]
VGIPPQNYHRISKKGLLHTVSRKAHREPLLFQHRALGATADKVLSTWTRNMRYFIGLYTRSTYKTLEGAHRAFVRTGGKGNKWI